MHYAVERINGHTNYLDSLANEFFKKMEKEYPEFTVINVQVVQLNTCVTMYIAYEY